MTNIIQLPVSRNNRPFYANYVGPVAEVIELPKVYARLSPRKMTCGRMFLSQSLLDHLMPFF